MGAVSETDTSAPAVTVVASLSLLLAGVASGCVALTDDVTVVTPCAIICSVTVNNPLASWINVGCEHTRVPGPA